MLKHVLTVASALALAALTSPAFAAGSGHVDISGSVAAVCNVTSPTHTVSFGAFTTAANGTYAGNDVQTQGFGDIWCNSASTLSVVAKPLVSDQHTTDTPFTDRVDYVVTSPTVPTPTSTVGSVASTGATTTVNVPQAFDTGTGTFDQYTITTVSSGSNKLVAGTYSGTIDITLTPAS